MADDTPDDAGKAFMLHDLADVLPAIDDCPIRTAPLLSRPAPAPAQEDEQKVLYVLAKLLNSKGKDLAADAPPNKAKDEGINSPSIIGIPETLTTVAELKEAICDFIWHYDRAGFFCLYGGHNVYSYHHPASDETEIGEVNIRWRPDDEGWDQRIGSWNIENCLKMLKSTPGPHHLAARTNWIWTTARGSPSFSIFITPGGPQNRREEIAMEKKAKENSRKRKLERDSDEKGALPIPKRKLEKGWRQGKDDEGTDTEDEAVEKQSKTDEDTDTKDEAEQKPKYSLRVRKTAKPKK